MFICKLRFVIRKGSVRRRLAPGGGLSGPARRAFGLYQHGPLRICGIDVESDPTGESRDWVRRKLRPRQHSLFQSAAVWVGNAGWSYARAPASASQPAPAKWNIEFQLLEAEWIRHN